MIVTQPSALSGTHYWLARKSGQVYNGVTYVDYAALAHASYAITAVDAGFGMWTGTVPSDSDTVQLIKQQAGSPATNDILVAVKENIDLSGIVVDLGDIENLLAQIAERTDRLPDRPADQDSLDAVSETLLTIQERTDRLPDDPADASDINTDTSELAGLVQQALVLIQQVKTVVQSRAHMR